MPDFSHLEPNRLKDLAMRSSRPVRWFLPSSDGNVAVIFALASLPILAFTGAAIDYGSATRLQVKLQGATDATALSLCQTKNSTTTPQLQLQAETMVAGYMGNDGLTVDPIVVTTNPRKIVLTTHMTYTTLFGKFIGTEKMAPELLPNARPRFRRRSRSHSSWTQPAP